MRDFTTLIAAVSGTEISCRIAAREIRIPGRLRALRLAPDQVAEFLSLWANPAEAARLGAYARAYIETSRHTNELFSSDVAAAVKRVAASRGIL